MLVKIPIIICDCSSLSTYMVYYINNIAHFEICVLTVSVGEKKKKQQHSMNIIMLAKYILSVHQYNYIEPDDEMAM